MITPGVWDSVERELDRLDAAARAAARCREDAILRCTEKVLDRHRSARSIQEACGEMWDAAIAVRGVRAPRQSTTAAIDWLLKTDIHAQGSESARRDFARRTVDRILALAEQPRGEEERLRAELCRLFIDGDEWHLDGPEYRIVNLLEALEVVPDTGDWYAEVRSLLERLRAALPKTLDPNRSARDQIKAICAAGEQ